MIIINENIIKAAHRLFLLLILISIILLAPWPQRNDDSPNSLLEWISAHLLSQKSKPSHATTSPHNYHTKSHKHDEKDDINTLFLHGLARGFYDIGIVLVAWFSFMCIVGGACRAYLCMEECWNRRFYSVLPLFREEVGDSEADTSVETGEFDMRQIRRGETVYRVETDD
jgi:hypothetical protein